MDLELDPKHKGKLVRLDLRRADKQSSRYGLWSRDYKKTKSEATLVCIDTIQFLKKLIKCLVLLHCFNGILTTRPYYIIF